MPPYRLVMVSRISRKSVYFRLGRLIQFGTSYTQAYDTAFVCIPVGIVEFVDGSLGEAELHTIQYINLERPV